LGGEVSPSENICGINRTGVSGAAKEKHQNSSICGKAQNGKSKPPIPKHGFGSYISTSF
jgi:hypothetical protein